MFDGSFDPADAPPGQFDAESDDEWQREQHSDASLRDPYAVLNVARDASASEIKSAKKALVKQHHPDKGGDRAAYEAVQLAYDVLLDPQLRAAYDYASHAGVRRARALRGACFFNIKNNPLV